MQVKYLLIGAQQKNTPRIPLTRRKTNEASPKVKPRLSAVDYDAVPRFPTRTQRKRSAEERNNDGASEASPKVKLRLNAVDYDDSPRLPCKSIYNPAFHAGGSPPFGSAASNFHAQDARGRPAIRQKSPGIPYYKCGFKKTYHAQGREKFNCCSYSPSSSSANSSAINSS